MQKRIYSLDFLRLIAIISIIFHHYQQLTGTTYQRFVNFYGGNFSSGYFVEFFFVLSGFLQFSKADKIRSGQHDFRDYMKEKLIRLMPMLMISTVVMSILILIFHNVAGVYWMDTKPDVWSVLVNLAGMSSGWGLNVKAINSPMWYISVLLICYICFYVLVRLSGKININEIWLFMITIIINLGISCQKVDFLMINAFSSRGLYSFFSGVMLAWVLKRISMNRKRLVTILACILLWAYVTTFHVSYVENGISYIMACFIFPMVITLFCSKPLCRLFKSERWMTVGKITFDVYVWHMPILLTGFIISYIFTGNADAITGSFAVMMIYTVLCFIAGTVLYYTLDVKIEKKLKSAFDKKPAMVH